MKREILITLPDSLVHAFVERLLPGENFKEMLTELFKAALVDDIVRRDEFKIREDYPDEAIIEIASKLKLPVVRTLDLATELGINQLRSHLLIKKDLENS